MIHKQLFVCGVIHYKAKPFRGKLLMNQMFIKKSVSVISNFNREQRTFKKELDFKIYIFLNQFSYTQI